jgi:hypothetical protein
VSATGEILYDEQPWRSFIELDPPDMAVEKWLGQWLVWFTDFLGESWLKRVEPAVWIDPRYRVPTSTQTTPVTPPAYAVFGRFAVPLEIRPLDQATRAEVPFREYVDTRGTPEKIRRRYEDAGIYYVNDLAFSWVERLTDVGGELINPVRHQIYNAMEAAQTVNQSRLYLEGMDPEIHEILKMHNINDDVGLANADLRVIAALVGSESFAAGLIAQARTIVPAESWSIQSLGLTNEQVRIAEAQGIDSLGMMTEMLATPEGRQTVSRTLDIEGATDAALDATLERIELNAITTMTMHSIALAPQHGVATLDNVDAVTATKIGEAGISSADQLATMDAATVAATAGISLASAELAVQSAKASSEIAIGQVAGANNVISGIGMSTPAGSVLSLSEDALAGAFGGNAARAGAVKAGISAGIAARTGAVR